MNKRCIDTVGGGGGAVKSCHIFAEVISVQNLFFAWKEFKRGKMSKADVQNFALNLEDNIFELHEELRAGIYQPGEYKFFYVRDPKLRPIHKATVRDRVVFQAVFRILYHIFDRLFIFDSYSCRFKKGTHAGVERLEEFAKKESKKYRRGIFVLKCDVKHFFYSIDHKILMRLISREIQDEKLLNLINIIINSFCVQPGKGLPLGNVTSQLFANIYLNELDQFVKHVLKEKYYIRYCDDFVIVSRDFDHLKNLVAKLSTFLQENLTLNLHPRKIQIQKLKQGIDFLGYVTLPNYKVLRSKTKKRIFKKMKVKVVEFERGMITRFELNQTAQSYFGLLKHGDTDGLKRKFRKEWLGK